MTPEWWLPIVASAALGYWTNRLNTRADRAELRLTGVEQRAQAAEVRLAAHEERIAASAARVESLDEALADIRDHMARREDLADLRRFIEERIT